MTTLSDQRLFDALATLCRACNAGAVPGAEAGEAEAPAAPADPESRAVLGEAALAVAFGAFAEQEDLHGAMQALLAALGLLAIQAGEEPDPPAEILGIAAEDARVEAEIDRAGEALDAEFGRSAEAATLAGALEARILGSAITLAGCTLPEGVEGQAQVRLRAARSLVRLAAGLVALNAVGAPGSSGTA
jgi:hypothetical protein